MQMLDGTCLRSKKVVPEYLKKKQMLSNLVSNTVAFKTSGEGNDDPRYSNVCS